MYICTCVFLKTMCNQNIIIKIGEKMYKKCNLQLGYFVSILVHFYKI